MKHLLAESFSVHKGTIKLIKPKGNVREMRFDFDDVEGVIIVSEGPRKGYSWHEFTGYSPSP